MILRIVLLFLIIVLSCFLIYFLYGVFIPAIKEKLVNNANPLFSSVDITKIEDSNENNIEVTDKKAFVLCNCDRSFDTKRLNYNGIKSCKMFSLLYQTDADCAYGCVGFGDCAKVCPQQAILIKNNTAIVTKNCCGCGKCVSECPKSLIKMYTQREFFENDSIKLCNASEGCMTTCSKFNSRKKMEIPEQKYFKFWKSWYKILIKK